MIGRNERKGFASAILAAVLYGSVPLLVSVTANAGVGTYMLIFAKNLFSLPILLCSARLLERKNVLPLRRRDLLQCALLMLLGCVLTLILLFPSYALIGTAAATSLHFCYPVVILVVGAVFFRERVRAADVVCFALCAAGVAFLYTRGAGASPLGAAMAVASGFAFGMYSLLIERFRVTERLGSHVFLFWVNALSLAPLLVICLLAGELRFDFSLREYGLLVLIAVFDTILPSLLYQNGIRLIGSRKTALLGTLEPVTSILIGVAVLRERVRPRSLLGMALIIAASVLLVAFSRGERKEKE